MGLESRQKSEKETSHWAMQSGVFPRGMADDEARVSVSVAASMWVYVGLRLGPGTASLPPGKELGTS